MALKKNGKDKFYYIHLFFIGILGILGIFYREFESQFGLPWYNIVEIVFTWYFVMLCWVSYFSKIVKAPSNRAIIARIMIFGPIAYIWYYFNYKSDYPLITNFDGFTTEYTMFLTVLTITFQRTMICFGLLGYHSILARYLLQWFGLRGGIWTPFVQITGLYFQTWCRIWPVAYGGLVDMGPVIGLGVHKKISEYFDKDFLWLGFPTGILNVNSDTHTVDSLDSPLFKNSRYFYDLFISEDSINKLNLRVFYYIPFSEKWFLQEELFRGLVFRLGDDSVSLYSLVDKFKEIPKLGKKSTKKEVLQYDEFMDKFMESLEKHKIGEDISSNSSKMVWKVYPEKLWDTIQYSLNSVLNNFYNKILIMSTNPPYAIGRGNRFINGEIIPVENIHDSYIPESWSSLIIFFMPAIIIFIIINIFYILKWLANFLIFFWRTKKG